MINYEIPHDIENLEEHIIAIHLKNVIPETVAHKLMNGVHIEQDGKYLMLHRIKKKNDLNQDKWVGIGGQFEEKER